jgi:HEXXH motif-containing protein
VSRTPTLTGDNDWIVAEGLARRRRAFAGLALMLEVRGLMPSDAADVFARLQEASADEQARVFGAPLFGRWHRAALGALESGDFPAALGERLRRLVEPAAPAGRELRAGPRLDVETPEYADLLADTVGMHEHLREDTSEPLRPVGPESAAEAAEDFGRALDALAADSPTDLEDVRAFTRVVVPFRGSGVDSFSRNDCPGALYVNWRPGDLWWNAEHLIHENGHQRLYAIQEICPLWLNPPEARYRSPWRRDPRPIEGIFQATYVFYLTVAWLLRALARHPEAEPGRRPYLLEQIHNLELGRTVLREHARLSEEGRAFFGDLESAVERAARAAMAC